MRTGRRGAAPVVLVAVLAALVVVLTLVHRQQESGSVEETTAPVSEPPTAAPQQASSPHRPHRRPGIALDLAARSTTDPSSIWVVVNKVREIHPLDFRPRLTLVRGYQVADAAARPLARLLRAGDAAGLGFKIASAFRSYAYQEQVHDALVASRGPAAAARVSALPGHSEHQTGLAVDLVTPASPGCDLAPCFSTTRAGRWLSRNAWRDGFIVRYTRQNRAVTGYAPEPWHLRYVGRPLAAAMRADGIASLEQALHVGGRLP